MGTKLDVASEQGSRRQCQPPRVNASPTFLFREYLDVLPGFTKKWRRSFVSKNSCQDPDPPRPKRGVPADASPPHFVYFRKGASRRSEKQFGLKRSR